MEAGERARAGTVLALGARVIRGARDDRVIGVSAEVAFFALLAIPPTLVVLAVAVGSVTGWVGAGVQERMVEGIITGLGGFLAPGTMEEFVRPAVEGVFGGDAGVGVVSVGVVLALWSSSRVVKVLIEAMNIAYGVEDWRSAWKRRLVAVGLTLGGILAFTLYLPFLVAGPRLGRVIDDWVGLAGAFSSTWSVLYWPIAVTIGIGLLATLYHVAPNWRTPWRRDLPGALLAAIIWVGAALALRVYVDVAVSDTTFGPLAAPVVLLLWLFVTALAVLLGAELNGAIERTWPSSEAAPEATPEARADETEAGGDEAGGDETHVGPQ